MPIPPRKSPLAALRVGDLEQLPGLAPERAQALLQEGPFFSYAELQQQSGVSAEAWESLVDLGPRSWSDGQGPRRFDVVPDRFQVQLSELESDHSLLALGYHSTRSIGRGQVLIRPSETESAQLGALKRQFGERLTPVFRDAQGLERLLRPRSVDLWFRPGVSKEQRDALLARHGLRAKVSQGQVGFVQAEVLQRPTVDPVQRMFTLLNSLSSEDTLAFAEPDEHPQPVAEARFPALPASDLEAADADWYLARIAATQAHAHCTGHPRVVVVVADTGASPSHPALADAWMPGWEALDLSFELGEAEAVRSPDPGPLGHPHGTQVLGVIHAVAPDCSLLPVRIPASAGEGEAGYGLRAAAILATLNALPADHRAVLNLSWRTHGDHRGIREALRRVEALGVPIACSAGNHPLYADQPHYPSDYCWRAPRLSGLLSVAAVDHQDRKASYTFYGQRAVSLCAPGGEAGSAARAIRTTAHPQGQSLVFGTSFAAPQVAAVLALMRSVELEQGLSPLSAGELAERLLSACDSVDAANPGLEGMLGRGRLNAERSLLACTTGSEKPEPTPGPPVDQPTPEHQAPLPPGVVNPNLATQAELMTLPFVGSYLAESILAHRPFASRWSLVGVPGVSAWMVGQWGDRLVV